MTKRVLSDAARRIRPAVFAEFQARVDRLAAEGKELIPLHIGDTHLPPPQAARRVLGGFDADDPVLHRYGATAGLAPLREAMARVLARRELEVDPASEIVVGNGGTHALYCAARAVLDAGDEVIVASPYWPLAPGVFIACGAVPVEAPLSQQLYEDPSRDPAKLLASALTERTKAVYFISPNNPDGKVFSAAQLERIAAFAREHDLWVFSDEVYADIVFSSGEAVTESSRTAATPGGRGEATSIATLPGMRERTITLHSLSKSHALAGLRVGFVTAPEPVVTAARRVSTHTAFNVSVAMQHAAVAALADDAFPTQARDAYRSARDAAIAALHGAPIDFHVAEGATYLFVDFARALAARDGVRAAGPRAPIRLLPSSFRRFPSDRFVTPPPDTPVSVVVAPRAARNSVEILGPQTDRCSSARPLYAILERAVDRGVLLAPGDAFGEAFGKSFARLCFTSVPPSRVVSGIERLREALDAYLADRP
ncbi:MAG TPA: pyridoxal phosphate-dependent aminotransferase [Labilithrix sp.]|nr:pyridoxal phosphate-dependent aminotransferase [Labilithrix sp.]